MRKPLNILFAVLGGLWCVLMIFVWLHPGAQMSAEEQRTKEIDDYIRNYPNYMPPPTPSSWTAADRLRYSAERDEYLARREALRGHP